MKRSIINKSLSVQIYESLREQIIRGELQPGDRIVELELAKNFGVSQAPVREALLKLGEEDLVISHRNKGTFVSNVSIDEMDDLYSFRVVMEEFAIKRAFEKMTNEDIKALEALYLKIVSAGEKNELDALRAADIDFHCKIYDVADHTFMRSVWGQLVLKLNRIWYLTSQMYFTDLLEIASIHEPILVAFKNRDLDGCIKAFNEHVNYEKKKRVAID
jgi:DNA-binding GntR family transcriptional regulator